MAWELLAQRAQSPKRQRAIELATGSEYLTLQQIGDILGLTRERIRQYLVGIGRTPYLGKYHCERCGERLSARTPFCTTCWQILHAPVLLTCTQCGSQFPRRRSDVNAHQPGRWGYKTNNVFCNKKCQGHYTAQHFGFAMYPGNIGAGRRLPTRREQVRWLAMKGYQNDEIGRILGQNQSTVWNHLKAIKVKENKTMPWVKVMPYGRRGAAVYIQSGRGGVCSIQQTFWQGDVPTACDIYVDTDASKMRIEAGTIYKAKHTRSRFLLNLKRALTMLDVEARGFTPPGVWKDGGLEIDVSNWVNPKETGFQRVDKG